MNTSALILAIAVLPAFAFAQSMPPGHPPMGTAQNKAAPAGPMPPGHPPMGAMPQEKATPAAQLPHKGKVLSTLDVPNYTYIEVSEANKTLWLAAPTAGVKKGDVIRFEDGMVMTNFHSKTLNRTFPSISFINTVAVTKEK
jgi:hypothetical protein